MKKMLLVLAAALLTHGAFAKKWTNNVGVGFTLPVANINVDERGADDVLQISYGIEETYIGYHENGFTAKASAAIGLATSDDIRIAGLEKGDNPDGGLYESCVLGAGYSIVRTDKVLFGVVGTFGLEFSHYFASVSYGLDGGGEELADDTDYMLSLVTLSLGADVYACYRFTPHFGMFTNVGFRCPLVGVAITQAESSWKVDDTSYSRTRTTNSDLAGIFIVQPTVGVMWHF